MMNKFFITLALCLGLVLFSKAQTPGGSYKDYFREGNYLLLEDNYDLALKNFLEAYKLDSSNANINFNLGFAYLKSNKKARSESYLAKAITNVSKNYIQDDPNEKAAPPLAHFYYGQALSINYKFDEAINQYTIFETFLKSSDKESLEDLNYYRQQCLYAKEAVAVPINVQITNLGDSINSEFPDFSPTLSADERTIIYTTRRDINKTGERTPDGQFFEDIAISYKDDEGHWSTPTSISNNINTIGHEAAISLTPDGQTLVAYKDDGGNGNIYFSNWDGKDWSGLQSFGSDINSKYWETHACFSPDGNTLYMVSDRPGGLGGRDIYRCVKLPNGKWSKALNLGSPINTKYDEDAPFMHPDGTTLFFSSNGHKSMGGFDIMFSARDAEGKFTEPINIGYPINTPDDDIYYVTSPDGKRGYFSSDKDGGFGEKDIYVISIPDATDKPLALFKGSIIPAETENLPEDMMIVVTDTETGELVGTYKPKKNGTFSTILPPNKNYNFSYQASGQEFYNEDLYVSNEVTYQEISKAINLEPVKLLGKVKVKDKLLALNTIVLNNPTDKKPVANAKISLTDKSNTPQVYTTDDKGKKDGIALSADNTYSLYAESDGKKSAASAFNTKGVKGSKTYSQVLYMDGKPAVSNDLKHVLDVVVLNNKKQRKPITNSTVTLKGNDGSKYEAQTDDNGKIKGIELLPNVNYELIAENAGNYSDKLLFTTVNAKVSKTYNKTLYVSGITNATTTNSSTTNSNNNEEVASGPSTEFKHNFKYNKNQIDKSDEKWTSFIETVTNLSKNGSVNVNILSSASKVPTRKYKNNKELSSTRAKKMEKDIKASVTEKGGDVSKITFTKRSIVGGPKYKGDWSLRRKTYEKYQYVKVTVK